MRLFLRFHTFSKIYDPIVPAFLIRLHSHSLASSHRNTRTCTHTHIHYSPENVAPHVFGPHISLNFLFGFSRAFPRLRLSFTVDVALKLKQKLKLISGSSGAFVGASGGDSRTHTSLYQRRFGFVVFGSGKVVGKGGRKNRVPSISAEFAVFISLNLLFSFTHNTMSIFKVLQ